MNEGRFLVSSATTKCDRTSLMSEDGTNYGSVPAPTDSPSNNDETLPIPCSLAEETVSTNLYLYDEDNKDRPHIASAINNLANYSATIQQGPTDSDLQQIKSAELGTMMGVYLPCIQNIFGVILFIRMTWIVGTAGVIQAFLVVLMCCCVTLTTAISMAAIATNGVVPGGGSYFMISRALGPEFGGAVGILFYLATSVAGAMYIIGAIEILTTYIVGSSMSLFGPDITDDFIKFNNYRVYGTFLLILMGLVVFVGVKFVNKFASVALACVLLTIASIYVGFFVNFNGNSNSDVCVLGTRLIVEVQNCSKEVGTDLFNIWCSLHANSTNGSTLLSDFKCDEYFLNNEAHIENGIKGLSSDAFFTNLYSKFHDRGDAISSSNEESEFNLGGFGKKGFITTDIYTSFVLLVGIFFPSCTGIMAGSNRSGDLADPQKSIPVGTILAILTTSIVYLSSVLFIGASVNPLLLRDKFGESIGGSLVIGNIAWPHPKVIEIGSLLSTIGAGLQSLTGAPRLLQAIAKDGIIPFLHPLRVQSAGGEPVRALAVTLLICEIAVLIGNVDEIAPLLSMFFLMCYGFVNLACALQTLLRTPNWRPRFTYYHWSLSLFGVVLCITVMFMSSWYYALLAMAIAVIIYKYIEYRGAEKEWGDGLRGVALSAARFSLLRLEEGPPHTKNWRPQILILAKLDSHLKVKHKRLFSLASQLKAGKGLTIGVAVIEGNYTEMAGEAAAAKLGIRQILKDEDVKGFPDILVSRNICDGISHLIQTSGLGGMNPNTVILGWPNNWRKKETSVCSNYVNTIRVTGAAKMALLVPKGIRQYPESGDKVKGNIDIWWIVHDGGLLMLLPFLLTQHRTWKNCKLRIFSIAQDMDNSVQMKNDLIKFLYQLRIEADVQVVEMPESDISQYTYERTLIMEQRNALISELRAVSKKNERINLDTFAQDEDRSPSRVKFSDAAEFDNMENGAGNTRSITTDENSNSGESSLQIANNNLLNVPAPPSNSSSLNRESSNLKRMHTAVKLNEEIVHRSHEAKLVILNLPSPPKTKGADWDSSYMEFLEVLTEGLDRVLMVRGGGREVITIYS